MEASKQLFEKAKLGLLMGGATGMAVGFLVGSFTVLRLLGTIGTQMIQTGGFLGFIFGVGMLLRSEDESFAFNNKLAHRRSMFAPKQRIHIDRSNI
ncbi:hypothetical protein BC829DRAFT_402738 [Chytridium lagenaria]|nr:hypothetical protein BC829DRAFT_402738 [Chytridium lagenaria]